VHHYILRKYVTGFIVLVKTTRQSNYYGRDRKATGSDPHAIPKTVRLKEHEAGGGRSHCSNLLSGQRFG
jgi:hypothetical protein